ncbi:MAG: zinc ribbon domain-containing protein [Thermoanaerobaculia bacterium]|nr:zinc ribbon domain-containing protein [Thermoanaerobaculia bacterium]
MLNAAFIFAPTMPIYEFYCPDCNTLFNFFSKSADPDRRPECPRCGRPDLEKRPSRFAIGKPPADEGAGLEEDDLFAGLDEDRLEKAMMSMAGEIESMGEGAEEDPRAMAHFLRRFGEATGMEAGPRMEEMLSRLEAGEDPESLEQEMGGDLDDEGDLSEWFQLRKKAGELRERMKRPRVDDTLYFL